MSAGAGFGRGRLSRGRLSRAFGWLVCFGFCLAGCQEPVTEFHMVNVRGAGDREDFHQVFSECYYAISPGGRVDVVARRVDPDQATGLTVTQLVHMRTAFRAVPGTTFAEQSMINATVHFAVLDGHGGVCYEGAGFLSTEENARRGLLVGELERAHLDKNRSAGRGGEVFQRVDLTGTYHAVRNRAKVFALLNEMNRLFGPQPDYIPPPRHSDPL